MWTIITLTIFANLFKRSFKNANLVESNFVWYTSDVSVIAFKNDNGSVCTMYIVNGTLHPNIVYGR